MHRILLFITIIYTLHLNVWPSAAYAQSAPQAPIVATGIDSFNELYSLSIKDSSTQDTVSSIIKAEKPAVDIFANFLKEQNEKYNTYPNTIFYSFLFLLLLLGIVRLLDNSIYRHLFLLQFTPHSAISVIKEKFHTFSFNLFLLAIAAFFSLTIYLYVIVQKLTPGIDNIYLINWNVVGMSALVIAVLFLTRLAVISMFGYLFNQNSLSVAFRYKILVSMIILGLISLPFTIIIAFSTLIIAKLLITISLCLLLIILIIDLFRFVKPLGNVVSKNKFHFFLYLCTAEILPLAIMLKYFSNILF